MSRAHTLAEALRFGRGIERPFLCPEHGDSRPSASVNTIKKVWTCYTCHAHGTLGGEALLAEPDYHTMRLWLDNKLAEGTIYPESWLSRYDAGPTHPYWLERVGEAAARRFRLGSDSETDTYTYPLRDPRGRVLGIVRRSSGGMGPKYKYPQGVDVGRLLFNYTADHREAVVLVEGALDAIALWNTGVDAFAIYGSRLSAEQVRLIDRVDPERIYTCYDMDDAGWEAYRMTERSFKHRLVTRLYWPRAWGKDIDEIGETRRRKVVDGLASVPATA
jgi:5S rRNA maturation endonuclease (ribonuclease M5)